MNQYGKPFLTADWRYPALLNYESDPALLQPMVPAGMELDTWNGKTFVSMVGFSFLNTRVLGLAIPLHGNCEEINLHFYMRHKAEDGWRRGVVFIKEIVPRAAIAWRETAARWSIVSIIGSGVSGRRAERAWRAMSRSFTRAVRRGFARHAVVGVSRRRAGDNYLSRSEAGLRFRLTD